MKNYLYGFDDKVPMQEVADSLRLAEIAVRGLHGDARARLDVQRVIDEQARYCRIDAATDVGEDLATIFTAFLSAQFPDGEFSVTRGSAN